MFREEHFGFREHLEEFIRAYRNEPCLWMTKSKDYHDRNKKDAAYGRLIETYKAIDPHANREIVVKKINNLRTTYKKELKKQQLSQTFGAGAEETYTPRLWYFHLLDFLYDQETPRTSMSDAYIHSWSRHLGPVKKIGTLSPRALEVKLLG
ncbi:uncharacterized protein LOC111673968 [Orussus abietinus]|uniref:uncharacterized protein LOC111673968 n=1 Tax=Orussus abietinus TaxID=222816 RepID=UPI000C716142|nr:uncharacterized protein LOC111673968 [Orussus abietinus]